MKTQVLMNTYAQLPVTFTHGEGLYLVDDSGKKYLDFVAGIAVNGLGYSHEGLKTALKDQVDKLLHVSNLYYTDTMIEAAEELSKVTEMDKVFFCNSGAEAVEASLKLARKYAAAKGYEDRYGYVTMKNSFHGRTMGAITATGQTKYQKGLGPLLPGVTYAEFNNLNSVIELVDAHTCAVVVEVLQGEGGIVPAEKDFLQGLRQLCDEKDICLIFDEVQTGAGRLGEPCGHMVFGVKPDIMAMAKGLGAGVPVGACLANNKVAIGFEPGDHASTFGGNPLAMAAVQVVIRDMLNEQMMNHVKEMGKYLKECLEELKSDFTCIKEVKGLGLMQGISLEYPPKELTLRALDEGLLLVGAGSDVVRFVPPLVVDREAIDR